MRSTSSRSRRIRRRNGGRSRGNVIDGLKNFGARSPRKSAILSFLEPAVRGIEPSGNLGSTGA